MNEIPTPSPTPPPTGAAMAGESTLPNPHRPLRPPPPLLFQFPTLSPVPSWFHHPQPDLPPPHPLAIPMQQHQQHPQQQPQLQPSQVPGFQFGNLNSFQRAASAPDLNRLPVPFSAPSSPLSLGFGCPATTSAGLPSQTSFFREPMLVFPHAPTPGQLHLQQQQQQQVAQMHAGFEVARVSPGGMVQAPASSSSPQQKVARSVYPPALAAQEDVVSDSDAFFKTLNKFFEYMGWELIIPRVGGKVFEIHRLYCEVTEQGGLEKVTRQKKWKDIATAFVLPKTVTSPTYFLRKHYINILHHYEQVYYHRKQGPIVRAPDALPGPLQAPQQQKTVETDLRKKKRMKFDQVQGSKVDPLESLGHTVTGAIEGKFDHGYFVTVVVGSEKLRGVIYSVPEDQPPEDEGEEDVEEEETLLDPARTTQSREPLTLRPRKRKRGRPEGSRRDPNAVRLPRNAYNFFVADKRLNMRGPRTELSKTIGIKWKELSAEGKLPYVALAKKDRERYEREMAERGAAREEERNEVEQDEPGEALSEMTSSRQPTDGAPGSNLPPRQDVVRQS